MTILNKAKWILGIVLVFLLILSTNLIDQNNFQKVKDSVVTIYEDRLVVKGLLYDLANLLHKKEIAFLTKDSVYYHETNESIHDSMDELIGLFNNTSLTYEEEKALDKFILNLEKLRKLDNGLSSDDLTNDEIWLSQMNTVKRYLDELSKIQIKEGNKQFNISQKAMDVVDLYTEIEIYFLIFLALLIQFIIIYSPRKKKTE